MSSTELCISEVSSVWDPSWPDADIIIPPGIPDWEPPTGDPGITNPYPSITTDVLKHIRQQGYTVEYTIEREQQDRISLKSIDCWLPVLIFAADVVRDVGIDVVANLIKDLIFRSIPGGQPRLHVKLGKGRSDGTVNFLEASGDADKVLEAISRWDWADPNQDSDANGH